MLRKIVIAALVVISFTGCTMVPVYKRPVLPVAENWPIAVIDKNNEEVPNAAHRTIANIGWRDFFTDPSLQQLIEIALKHNRDLQLATLNIEKARAQYQIQQADLLPSINASGQGQHQRITEDTALGSRAVISRQYSAGVGFSAYELDFFGRVRSLKDQALKLYYATEEAQRSSHISLIAEVANAYLTLLADNERLQLAIHTLVSQEKSYQLTKSRFKAGLISAVDLNQAITTVEKARADVALYTSSIARDKNALTVLLGRESFDNLPLDMSLEQTQILADLPPGVPSDLLQNRPDIMAAEYNLKAANANIGAARAAFLPSITLTASAGVASTELSQLFSGSGVWTFLPQISLPIFTGGKNIANLNVAHVTKNIHIAQYEKTIQLAFQEVADALAQRSALIAQLKAQRVLTAATKKTYTLSKLRYRYGIDNYLLLLDAQRSLYSAQQGLISTKFAQLSNLVNLYKALGGGWVETVDKSPHEASRVVSLAGYP